MTINTTAISPGKTLELLKFAWQMQKNGKPMSHMLHGKPGVGKSSIAQQLADSIGGKLYDLRLTTIEPSDLRGMPHYDHENKLTVWYRPEDLPRTDEPAVLLFDELTSANQFLQPTVYGILEERRIGQHTIPDNTIILGAGNGVEDGAVAFEMGTAISDRLMHYKVVAEPSDWVKGFAIPNKIHPAIIALVQTRSDMFHTIEESIRKDELIATTPRSLVKASNVLYEIDAADHLSQDDKRYYRTIFTGGLLGDTVATELAIVADDIYATVKVEEMLAANDEERAKLYPNNMYGLNALVFSLLAIELTEDNLLPIFRIMRDIRTLKQTRPEEDAFKQMPLKETATFAIDALYGRAYDSTDKGVVAVLRTSKEMDEYQDERDAEMQ